MHKYRRALQVALRQRGRFAFIFVLTLAAAAVSALQPWPLKLLADTVSHATPAGAFGLPESRSAALAVIVAAGFILFLLQSALENLTIDAWTVGGRRMAYDLAAEVFARLQRRSLLFHTRRPVADTMVRVTTDSWCAYQLMDALLIGPARVAFTLALMIFLMSRLDGTLTAVAVAVAPCMVAAAFLMAKPLRAVSRLKRDIETQMQSHIQQTLAGLPVVQAFAQETRALEVFDNFANRSIRAQQQGALAGSVSGLSSGLIATIGAGVILWLGAQHVLDNRLTLGGLLVFLYYLGALQTQLKTLADIPAALLNFDASVERVNEVLETPLEMPEVAGAATVARLKGRVAWEAVTFGYAAGRPVLRGVSLAVEPGEIIALTGVSGAGKTTLVNLIPRFFDPWEGRVLLDGTDARALSLPGLRSQVALVLQEPYLFAGSIAENIALGKPDATRGEIEAAARAAQAWDFIQRQGQGLDTVLGQRGVTLSGGEKQRLAIARALLKDAPILILDEPTSALDAGTEEAIFAAWNALMKGRTTFIIAHRPSTIRRSDRVVVLENGIIREARR